MNNETYNYLEAVKEDVRNYIESYVDLCGYTDRLKLENFLNDTLWTEDSVTGNGSGSYTFNIYTAENYLCHNWELLLEALEKFGCEKEALKNGAEWCDVSIRCFLLAEAISGVLDDMEGEKKI